MTLKESTILQKQINDPNLSFSDAMRILTNAGIPQNEALRRADLAKPRIPKEAPQDVAPA